MDHICVVFPILPGKTEDARAFQRELDTDAQSRLRPLRAADRHYQRILVHRLLALGDQLVAYMESADFNQALSMFSRRKTRSTYGSSTGSPR